MNDKMAKKLRRLARQMTQGKPDRQLIVGKRATMRNADDWCALNNTDTFRGTYRFLKNKMRGKV
jgi:hypothetical protein